MPADTAVETTTSEAADTGSAGEDDGFIDSIIEAEGESFNEPARPEPARKDDGNIQQEAAAEEPAAEEEAPVEDEANDQELANLAAEMGLSPANPRDKAILDKLAQKLASGTAPAAATAAAPELTEFEKSLLEQTDKPPEAPETKPETPAAAVQPRLGDKWQRPEDAYQALTEAYGNGENPPDLAQVVAIEHEMFDRRFQARAMPEVEKAFEGWLKQRLGPMLPQIEAIHNKAVFDQNYDFALAEISKTKGFENFNKMFEKIDDAKIKFNGREWPNNAVNQVYAKYPHLLDIRVQHQDKNVAERLTNIKRLRAVKAHWDEMNSSAKTAANNIPAAKAGELVKAGAEQEKRKAADRTRQTLNAGTGASGNGVKRDSNSDWFDEVNRSAGGVTLSDLFK